MSGFALWFASSILALPIAAQAAPERTATNTARVQFTIPAQSLAAALIQYGEQSNVQVLTAGGAVSRLRSKALSGTYTRAAALTRLLRDTGLEFAFVDVQTVAVIPHSTASARPGGAAPAAAVTEALEPITVLGIARHGFMIETGNGVSRTETDLLDLPEAASEVPHDLLDSQQATTVADAVRDVAGVQFDAGSDALAQFRVRGFYVGNGMTDGLPNSVSSYTDLPPLAGIDRVEVLRGPQAILGDASVNNNFGGLVNIVLKKPVADPVDLIDFRRDQFGDTQVDLDRGGALDADAHWTYRLILSGEYARRTPQGRIGPRNDYLAPSLGWQDEDTRLTVGLQSLTRHEPLPDYAVLLGDTVFSALPDRLLIGHRQDHSVFQSARLAYEFEHDMSPGWTFRSRGQYVRQFDSVEDWMLSGFSPNGDVTTAVAESFRYADAFYTLQNDVVGHLGAGAILHTLTAGFDYTRTRLGASDDYLNTLAMPYNLFSGPPLPRAREFAMGGDDLYDPGAPWTTDKALFLQDQAAIGTSWDALLALRRWTYPLYTIDADGNPVLIHATRWVPNLGLVYKPAPDIALYASLINGFQPDEFRGKDNKLLPPSRSRQAEIGAKFEFGRRTLLTVAQYRIHLDHSYDLASPKPPYSIVPGPGQDNRGVEVEFNGNLRPGLDANFNYTNAMIGNRDGTKPTGAARHRLGAWLRYNFQGAVLRGWGIAGGVIGRSATLGQLTDGVTYFHIPGQARIDASVSYHSPGWSATLGVRNVFDRTLRGDDFDETFVPLQPGRYVVLSATWDLR